MAEHTHSKLVLIGETLAHISIPTSHALRTQPQ